MILGITYYENAKMLEKQIEFWNGYPEGVKIILIDDCSLKYPALDIVQRVKLNMDFELYRILDNIPLNSNGARNLLFTVASFDWIFVTDMDVVIPQDSMKQLMKLSLEKKFYYRIKRIDIKGNEIKTHRDTFIIWRDKFWRVGGYDEDFCGWQGGQCLFYKALDKKMSWAILDIPTVDYGGVISDAGRTDWRQNDPEWKFMKDPDLRTKMRAKYKPEDPLRFEWEREL